MLGLAHFKRYQISRRVQYDSIRLFSGRKDSYEYTRLLKQCMSIKKIKEIHAQIISVGYEQNPFLAANLVSRYLDYSDSPMDDARMVFDCVLDRDILLWNVIIRGYANKGPFNEALGVYDQMRLSGVCANKYTYPFLLKACGAMRAKIQGGLIHGCVVKAGLEFDLFVGNSLVAFYAKCNEIETSRKVFDDMIVRDVVSWNSMIAGYAQSGYPSEAVGIFCHMLQDGTIFRPDKATVVGVLPACAQVAAIKEGMWIHCYVIKSGMEIDVALGSGLIALYGSCSRVDIAREIFIRLPERNIVVWNAMIQCYGVSGYTDDALKLFSQMLDCGIQPDGISFITVLSVCSHGGLVDKGWELFGRMRDYGVERWEEHYACMVDLLGRGGQLDEAIKLVRSMPMKGGKSLYGALLGACRIHNNLELAEEVAERLFVLDPHNSGRYILLAKMYEDAGKFDDAARLRKAMKDKQIKKQLGSSALEVDCVVHTFGAEDETHALKGHIFDTLQQLEKVAEDGVLV